ncbi:MAG: hypothetical protein ABIV51_09250 [Saprospiraceae bacterium]
MTIKKANPVIKFVQILMGCMYIFMGLFIMWFDPFQTFFPRWIQYSFATLCIVYGAYRLYRTFRPATEQL